MADIKHIKLITFGKFEANFLEEIEANLQVTFKYPVLTEDGKIDITDFYNPSRHQYNGNDLLACMDIEQAEEQVKSIGLLQVDLYIPILTYIFGQAYLNGRSGIASLFRLKNERYGMQPNEELLQQRFVKEVIHELGHSFGLIHCHVPGCVMNSSTYVEDIDQKEKGFCPQCNESVLTKDS